MPDVHVVPAGDKWGCEINGNTRSTHDTQDEAVKHGRQLAEEQASELVLHAQDGSIRERTRTATTRATSRASHHDGASLNRSKHPPVMPRFDHVSVARPEVGLSWAPSMRRLRST